MWITAYVAMMRVGLRASTGPPARCMEPVTTGLSLRRHPQMACIIAAG